MNNDKCFCHFNGYAVKDAKARADIVELQKTAAEAYNYAQNANNLAFALEGEATRAAAVAAAADEKAAKAEQAAEQANDSAYNSFESIKSAQAAAENAQAAAEDAQAAAEDAQAAAQAAEEKVSEVQTAAADIAVIKSNNEKQFVTLYSRQNPPIPYNTELNDLNNFFEVPETILNYKLLRVRVNDGSNDGAIALCHLQKITSTKFKITGTGASDTTNNTRLDLFAINLSGYLWAENDESGCAFDSNTSAGLAIQTGDSGGAAHSFNQLSITEIVGVM